MGRLVAMFLPSKELDALAACSSAENFRLNYANFFTKASKFIVYLPYHIN